MPTRNADAMQDIRAQWDELGGDPPARDSLFTDKMDPYVFLASSLFSDSEDAQGHHFFLDLNPHRLRLGESSLFLRQDGENRVAILSLRGGTWDLYFGEMGPTPDISADPLTAARKASRYIATGV